jgi:hypothetical protein
MLYLPVVLYTQCYPTKVSDVMICGLVFCKKSTLNSNTSRSHLVDVQVVDLGASGEEESEESIT